MLNKLWQIAEPINEETKGLYLELDPILLQLLWNRGLTEQSQIDEFLNPDWSKDVHDPYLFKDMKRVVERIYESISRGEVIGIFGDYDADGVCAAALLTTTLQKLGAKTETYLPHREREGYGLNDEAIKYLHTKNVKLLITCDCGIASHEPVKTANSLGLAVIITDHHQAQATLPEAYAILHCGLASETYPFKFLSGGGVAFKLVQGLMHYDGCHLSEFEKEQWIKWSLDLVAISTVADMVKLKGENRTLTKYGLIVLQKTKRLGLKTLYEIAGIKPEVIDIFSIGFQIAPRINAAGRLDHANAAFALLMASNTSEARELANSLNLTNNERQHLTEEMFQQAKEQIGVLKPDQYLVAAFDPSWSLGMVGLVAGKLVQEYNRPAITIGQAGDKIAGSGRSGVGDFNLAEALEQCNEYLLAYGGHKEAAGFTIKPGELDNFLRAIAKIAKTKLKNIDLTPSIKVDAIVPWSQVDWNLYEQAEKLEPTGMTNPSAKFLSKNLTVRELRPVGSTGQHLKLVLEAGGLSRKFILFKQGDTAQKLS